MILGDIQGLEVVVIPLNLRPFNDGKANFHEDPTDPSDDLRNGVQAAQAWAAPRQGNVNRVFGQDLITRNRFEGCSTGDNPLFDRLLDLVCKFADNGTVLRGQRCQLAKNSGDSALATEKVHAGLLELSRVRAVPNLGDGLRLKILKILSQLFHPTSTTKNPHKVRADIIGIAQ